MPHMLTTLMCFPVAPSACNHGINTTGSLFSTWYGPYRFETMFLVAFSERVHSLVLISAQVLMCALFQSEICDIPLPTIASRTYTCTYRYTCTYYYVVGKLSLETCDIQLRLLRTYVRGTMVRTLVRTRTHLYVLLCQWGKPNRD